MFTASSTNTRRSRPDSRYCPDDYLGPYANNAVVILAFLLGVACLLWWRSLVDIMTCLVGAACVPMLWQTMTEARPDLPWIGYRGHSASTVAAT
jgi:hypothetical protein